MAEFIMPSMAKQESVKELSEQIGTLNSNFSTIVIEGRQTAAKQLLEQRWTIDVPNDENSVRQVAIKASGGTLFGYISRYSNNYGICLCNRYDGTCYAFYLNNGTVTQKTVNQT